MRKGLLIGAVAGVLALAGLLYASPYLTLHGIGQAVDRRDADAVSAYVDFPALRESVKAQALARAHAEIDRPDLKNNPLGGLGQLMAAAVVNPLVDALVSPAGVLLMLKNGKPGKLGDVAAAGAGVDTQGQSSPRKAYTVDYQGWSSVFVHPKGEAGSGFVFQREGLWGWKLVAIKMD